MPRPMSNRRTVRENRADATQLFINRRPSTITVWRHVPTAGSGIKHAKADDLIEIGSFEARVDWQRISGRNLRQRTMPGETTPTAYIMTAVAPTDRFGNTIDIESGDTVYVETPNPITGTVVTTRYEVTMEVVSYGYKIECTLERRD